MVKEHYRPFLVYYDDNRCIGFRNNAELEELALNGSIQHIVRDRQSLTAEEIGFYIAYVSAKAEKESAPTNLELVERLAQAGIALSRNQVAKRRRIVGQKLGFKKGW